MLFYQSYEFYQSFMSYFQRVMSYRQSLMSFYQMLENSYFSLKIYFLLKIIKNIVFEWFSTRKRITSYLYLPLLAYPRSGKTEFLKIKFLF